MNRTTKGKEIVITKASGEREPFSEAKLRSSLERVRTSPDLINIIVKQINGELQDGMSTSDIYSRASSILRRKKRASAGRYHLKRAIMELGPTGYPFEKLVGELFRSEGFSVEVGKTAQGACVSHEIDVAAVKDDRRNMIECKFHNQPGIKSDIKIALYVQARFEDVQKVWQKDSGHGQKFHEAWLVTNTKLTSDAIRYAECVGMKAIGWRYPLGNGLEARIDRAGLHPITCIMGLSRSHKQQLLAAGLVLCKELLGQRNLLRSLGLSESKMSALLSEINQLCQTESL